MTEMVKKLCSKVIVVLEGGYNVEVRARLQTMSGLSVSDGVTSHRCV